MTLREDHDKLVEFLVSAIGELRIVLRPELPFVAEGYRIVDGMYLEIFGEDRKVSFLIDEDLRDDVVDESIEQALLIEFGRDDVEARRERDILRLDAHRGIL